MNGDGQQVVEETKKESSKKLMKKFRNQGV